MMVIVLVTRGKWTESALGLMDKKLDFQQKGGAGVAFMMNKSAFKVNAFCNRDLRFQNSLPT